MMMKHTFTLEVAGTKFRLVADADQDHLQKLASTVNERVEELREKTSRVATPAQLLALVSLGLADDLLTARTRENRLYELTRTSVAQAIERIDRRIAAESRPLESPDRN